jgi:peptidoglycan lytic transglycosylase
MLIRFGVCLVGICFFLSGWGTGGNGFAIAESQPAADLEVASLAPGLERPGEMPLPQVLSEADADRYRRIFDVQVRGDWKSADALIAQLEDRLLMGHVLAQRYLHPNKYRSKYTELKDWMAEYADHPSAQRIYKLALKRRSKNWKYPTKPVSGGPGVGTLSVEPRKQIRPPKKRMSTAERRRMSAIQRQIRGNLRNGWTLAVKRIIETAEVKKLFDAYNYDKAQAALGAQYFRDGRDEWALMWAGRAAKRSGRYLPEAHWAAGLAAWRLGKLDEASKHFTAVAESPNSSSWMVSAGAFWAARSHLVNGDPTQVNRMLAAAAVYPRTFYGMLARRIQGTPTSFRWILPPLEEAAIQSLAQSPSGRRGLALIEAGEDRRAERDLRLLASRASPALARGIMALAGRAGMPELAVRLNNALFPHGGGFDGAAYPIPRWVPDTGFSVDRALIYALIRQESQFNPNAKSWAGARGLMQLMPSTASFVARDRRLRSSKRAELFDPEYNLELGQKYIGMLLGEKHIQGDLFLLSAAWNGGPGNLSKWQRNNQKSPDPLLFIESIPSRETRIFIERVLTNLWIYRDRLGQPSPSLDAIAAGERPVYIPMDQQSIIVARHGKNLR